MTRGCKLSDGERAMIVAVDKYFIAEKKADHGSGDGPRKRVVECLGAAEATVSRVWAVYNRGEATSEEQPMDENRGRPPVYDEDDLVPVIRTAVATANESRQPITSRILCMQLSEQKGVSMSLRPMTRILQRLNYRYIQGETRHYLAESVGNVAYRSTYLQEKLLNRDSKRLPVLPDVFLDESYCNVNHGAGKTWLTSNRTRLAASDNGARVCIIRAGIVYRMGTALRAHFVDNSLIYWNSNKKAANEDDYHGEFRLYSI